VKQLATDVAPTRPSTKTINKDHQQRPSTKTINKDHQQRAAPAFGLIQPAIVPIPLPDTPPFERQCHADLRL
jgi:hypothetical protein